MSVGCAVKRSAVIVVRAAAREIVSRRRRRRGGLRVRARSRRRGTVIAAAAVDKRLTRQLCRVEGFGFNKTRNVRDVTCRGNVHPRPFWDRKRRPAFRRRRGFRSLPLIEKRDPY